MPTRPIQQMLDVRRKELLALKYTPTQVDLSIEWAVGTAQGMAGYYTLFEENHDEEKLEEMELQILPRYLRDCESWIKKTCL